MAKASFAFKGSKNGSEMPITKKKVFITGANGLLGTNLVLMLVEQGFVVKAFVRRKSSFVKPELKNLILVEGNLLDIEKLNNEIKGCHYVVHLAANTSQSLLKLADYYAINVQGTRNIIHACIENQVEKLVYIGTANTFGYGTVSNPGDETQPMKSPFTKSFYASSKKQAQEIIDKAASQLNITTLSPTFMLGAYDTKPSSGKIIRRAINKRFVFYPSGGKNFVHVSDVATAIIKAFDLKQSGQNIIIAHENLNYKDFYKKMVFINNQKTTLLPVPNFLLKLIGFIGDFLRFLKIETNVSSVNIKILTINNYYTNKKAKQELNMGFTPINNVIVDSLRYFSQ